MSNSNRLPLSMLALLFTLIACATPESAPRDSNVIGTYVVETVAAGMSLTALYPTSSPPLIQATPTTGDIISPLSQTPSETPTATQTLAVLFTSTPLFPIISVSVPTNCRNGPGKVYQMEGALLVGETAQIFGRESTGKYWLIQNPDASDEYCWVWGEYATIEGNITFLPVYTPPPTPTPTMTGTPTNTPTPKPDFGLSYAGLDTCSGWWVDLKLKNTGPFVYKSMGISVKDTVTDVTLTHYSDGFIDQDGCLSTTTRDRINIGQAIFVSAPEYTYDPTGNKIRATVTLCSDVGQSGTCVTKTVVFTP